MLTRTNMEIIGGCMKHRLLNVFSVNRQAVVMHRARRQCYRIAVVMSMHVYCD